MEGLGVDDSACPVRTTVLFSGTTAVVVVAAVVVISKIIRACGFGNERVDAHLGTVSANLHMYRNTGIVSLTIF